MDDAGAVPRSDPPPGLPWAAFPEEELRLASVFNGGVSLAVWMGGATHELNRLVLSSHGYVDAYAKLLTFVRSTVVADVIAGTSAGGINGAALALGQANHNADLALLRDVWLEQGRFDTLLRRPFQGDPTSLLRGDEYFLPALTEAMGRLADQAGPRPFPSPDLDLQITTTLLEPSDRVVPDSLGQLTHQQVHEAHFHFDASDFPRPQLGATAAALGLAARCSASFPLAFEPSFVPVGAAPDPEDPLRPDMAPYASWVEEGDTTDRSRFAVDGGLLANTPLPQALRAIRGRPAHEPVRRALLLVYPHAQQEELAVDVRRSDPPTVAGGVLGLVTALRSHGGQTFLEELEEHNRDVDAWRGGREDALDLATRGSLYTFVSTGWDPYRAMRIRLSAAVLARRLHHQDWSYDRIREASLEAQRKAGDSYVPHLPPPDPSSLGMTADAAGEVSPHEWRWGPVVAVGVCDALDSMLRAAGSIAATTQDATRIRDARRTVYDAQVQVVRERDRLDEEWNTLAGDREPTQQYWRARLAAYRTLMLEQEPDPGDEEALRRFGVLEQVRRSAETWRPGEEVARAVWTAVHALWQPGPDADPRTPLEVLETLWDTKPAEVSRLQRWKALVTAPSLGDVEEPTDPVLRLLARLLALDCATRLLTSGDTTPGTQVPVKAAQLSLAVQHTFATASRRPADPAAGLNLGHFAGFLKRSWRGNDWTWGRLDAAQLLCEVALSPARLRVLFAMSPGEPDARVAQVRAWLEANLEPVPEISLDEVMEELVPVFDPDGDLPSRLPALAGLFARQVQREAIVEELPHLSRSIRADRLEQQNPGSHGELFLADNAPLLTSLATTTEPVRPRTADLALAAFDRAGIGREVVREEAGSDAMIRTAATTVGVVATVFGSKRLGIGLVAPVAKAVRGAAMVPYWLLTGLTAGGSTARLLARAGLLLAGVLFVLGLLGRLGGFSGYAAAGGVAALLGVLGYAALRTGTLLHGVVLLAVAGPTAAYAVIGRDRLPRDAGLSGLLSVVGVCAALWLLASLPWPLRSPRTLWLRWRRRPRRAASRRRRTALVVVLVVVVVVGLVCWWQRDPVGQAVGWLHDLAVAQPIAVTLTLAVVCTLAGARIAWRRGDDLRLRTRLPDATHREKVLDLPAAVAAMWSVVYGAIAFVVAVGLVTWLDAEPVSTDRDARQVLVFSAWWLLVLAVLLTLVLPFGVTGALARRLEAQFLAAADDGLDHDRFVEQLYARGASFRFLVRRDERLTGRGEALWSRYQQGQRHRGNKPG